MSDRIVSRPSTDEYRKNWELAFGASRRIAVQSPQDSRRIAVQSPQDSRRIGIAECIVKDWSLRRCDDPQAADPSEYVAS